MRPVRISDAGAGPGMASSSAIRIMIMFIPEVCNYKYHFMIL